MHKINQKIVNLLNPLNNPLLTIKLREWDRSYIIFAALNIPEEVNPWANISHKPPTTPIVLIPKKTIIIILM